MWIIQTDDGGYAVTGYACSFNGDVTGNHGFSDYWVLKIDRNGNTQWSKTYGGTYFDEPQSIEQTPDHGFIIGGFSYSFDGDVVNNHGACDWWILKVDSIGSIQWQQTYGGVLRDLGGHIQPTDDGGYIVYGETGFHQDSTNEMLNDQDIQVIKLNRTGVIQWQKIFGGSRVEGVNSILQTPDGGFILAIGTRSSDGDFNKNHSDNSDIWLMKLDRNGGLQWKKNLGGSGSDIPSSLYPTLDGGYVMAGTSSSKDGDINKNYGLDDFLIIKLDSIGNLQWKKSYGGILDDVASSIQQTPDGGYIVSGCTSSIGNDVRENNGLYDIWIIRLNDRGNLLWQKSIGGSGNDFAQIIRQVSGGGYVVAGVSDSGDGDITGNHGNTDFWIVKLKPE